MKWAFIRTFAAGGSAVIVGVIWTFLVGIFDWHGAALVVGFVIAVAVALTLSKYMDSLGPGDGMRGRQAGGASRQESGE